MRKIFFWSKVSMTSDITGRPRAKEFFVLYLSCTKREELQFFSQKLYAIAPFGPHIVLSLECTISLGHYFLSGEAAQRKSYGFFIPPQCPTCIIIGSPGFRRSTGGAMRGGHGNCEVFKFPIVNFKWTIWQNFKLKYTIQNCKILSSPSSWVSFDRSRFLRWRNMMRKGTKILFFSFEKAVSPYKHYF